MININVRAPKRWGRRWKGSSKEAKHITYFLAKEERREKSRENVWEGKGGKGDGSQARASTRPLRTPPSWPARNQ